LGIANPLGRSLTLLGKEDDSDRDGDAENLFNEEYFPIVSQVFGDNSRAAARGT